MREGDGQGDDIMKSLRGEKSHWKRGRSMNWGCGLMGDGEAG